MITDLNIDDFTRYLVRVIEKVTEVTLNNPDTNSPFPIALFSNPMKSIRLTEENIPVYSRFSFTIEVWTDTKYESMALFEKIDKVLRTYNCCLVGGNIDLYDNVTSKYRFGGRYEVNFNGLTNSFERIK